MNNSQVFVEEEKKPIDVLEKFQKREQELVKIIEALRDIQKSNAWSSLKSLIFEQLSSSLRKELLREAKKESPDTGKLNRVSGQLLWAERFSDLKILETRYQAELIGIRKKIYG